MYIKLIIENAFNGIKIAIFIVIGLFVGIGAVCAYNAYDKTWTIEDKQFKQIYDDYDDCIRNNMGTGTTEICDDESEVIYKNK